MMSMSMLLYFEYIVQNVYQACAYIEISFTKNMIYNINVNVFLLLFFLKSSPDNNNGTAHSDVLFWGSMWNTLF